MTLFKEIEQKVLKSKWNNKRPQISKTLANGRKREWRYHTPRLQTILQSLN